MGPIGLLGSYRWNEHRILRTDRGEIIKRILLGGPEVGQEALTRFYGLHIMVIPLCSLC